ncbi:MAG: molybdopterin molybdotransferase MoeA [bacterium]|nr:molybdopterin molybdotransferase MoeA [bacterium]
MEFLKLARREEIYRKYFPIFKSLGTKQVSIFDSAGYFLAEDIIAPENVPYFPRSTVDGYAVRAEDTIGASAENPVLLKIKGEIPMAEKPEILIEPGTAVKIWTGGWLPEGANAVVMLENASLTGEFVEVYRPVGAGENVIKVGDDVKKGEVIILKGKRLRPQEVGILQTFGLLEVKVRRKPRVLLIPTGNELVEPWQEPKDGKIRETNSSTVIALIKEYCELVKRHPIIRDSKGELYEVLRRSMADYDLILISGGSSKGSGDFAVSAIEEFEGSEILYHGVYISPGKPTIFARVMEKPIIGLPGHPVSSFVSTYLFVIPFLKYLQGDKDFSPKPAGYLTAGRDIPSKAGREEWIRVRRDGDYLYPLFSESGILSSLVKSDGLVRIPEEMEGIHKDSKVEFYPL